ncbi:unnamed protein product [Penicillium salamii]|uniref:Uncharacterized protein n=1 Tax=Penicillium salamii TaxID=1612424 RepID=A0A9W4JMD9_9EURO|nr:unnamed protein product [Penicillium salamii]CAG8334490.1 unnamed protein product [Penicillium salamii]CAG8340302.1 unnamed protein product [Penicillium salamii]CAG8382067.1 unnamed protein product [Penicillium salamii]CAG8388050.1 unnamed protein product [Penicillium salamii]
MGFLCQVFSLLAICSTAVMAFPQQTIAVTTTAAPAQITRGPELVCLENQTAIYTTDCTMGTPTSYCFSPEPPIGCPWGSFPSVWHPDHCMEESTCYPVTVPWITTSCSNGALPYSTSTYFKGTLAGGYSTILKEFLVNYLMSTCITGYSCSCDSDEWTSTRQVGSTSQTFCMPHSQCPPGMVTTAVWDADCRHKLCSPPRTAEINLCICPDELQTPVYPNYSGARPTGCAY